MRGEFSVFRQDLLNWFRQHQRILPWRSEPTLYKTVVSEFMLQQTQVDTVVPYFHRWLQQFPDFDALAAAPEKEVMKQWEGLGYYNRARNLRKLAISIVEQGVPQTFQDWLGRPGVGPYTAAAISSISQGIAEPVIDGNVIRVLCRITNDESLVRSSAEARQRLLPLASDLMDPKQPGVYNEAIMELGAIVCRKSKPTCLACPVNKHCKAHAAGNTANIPRIARRSSTRIRKSRLWLLENDRLLVHFYPKETSRLSGLAELPEIHGSFDMDPLFKRTRGISNEIIEESIYVLEKDHPEASRCCKNTSTQWVPVAQIDSIALSGPHKRWIHKILDSRI